MEKKYNLGATAAFGLEGIVARELRDLHMDEVTCENGRVFFTGGSVKLRRRCNRAFAV